MNHIDKFSEFAAEIFDRLYRDFPRPVGMSYQPSCRMEDVALQAVWQHTVDWLKAEGLVDVRSDIDGRVRMGLTSLCLRRLRAPSPAISSESAAETLTRLLKEHPKQAGMVAMAVVLGAGGCHHAQA